jgi:hypothetical protein
MQFLHRGTTEFLGITLSLIAVRVEYGLVRQLLDGGEESYGNNL